jgi:putative DNA-binding protein/CoA binding protein
LTVSNEEASVVGQRGRRNGSAVPRKLATPDADNAPTAEMPAVTVGEDQRARPIPEAAVARLAVYLRVLSAMAEQGATTVASEELAAAAGVNSAKLRKDLSYLGSYGTRGVGYEVTVLVGQIERTLGLTRQHKVAVTGIGNLGHALANYGGFPGRGFPVEALFDVDPDLIGVPVGGLARRRDTAGVPGTRDLDRRDRHAAARGPVGLRPVGRRGRAVRPELRPRGPPGSGPRRGAQSGPRGRTADPVVLRGTS